MKRVFLAAILVAAIGSPASAAGFAMPSVPSIVPDIGCVVGFVLGGNHCITFTQSGTIAQVRSEIMQIRNLTTMNVQGLLQDVASSIATVTQTAQANPTRSGDAAASQVLAQSRQAAQTQAAMDAASQSASGAEQRAQLAEAGVSVTNDQLIQGNAMQAAEIQHQQKKEDAEQRWQEQMFTNTGTSYTGGFK